MKHTFILILIFFSITSFCKQNITNIEFQDNYIIIDNQKVENFLYFNIDEFYQAINSKVKKSVVDEYNNKYVLFKNNIIFLINNRVNCILFNFCNKYDYEKKISRKLSTPRYNLLVFGYDLTKNKNYSKFINNDTIKSKIKSINKIGTYDYNIKFESFLIQVNIGIDGNICNLIFHV